MGVVGVWVGSIMWEPVSVGVGVKGVKRLHSGNAVVLGGPRYDAFQATFRVERGAIATVNFVWARLGVADAPIHGTFEIPEDVAGGVEVTLGWVLEVACEQAGDGGDVRASAHAEPVEAANH